MGLLIPAVWFAPDPVSSCDPDAKGQRIGVKVDINCCSTETALMYSEAAGNALGYPKSQTQNNRKLLLGDQGAFHLGKAVGVGV